MKMVPTILVLFLLISYAQPNISTSESRALNHSNDVQKHQKFLERLWYGSMEEEKRLGENGGERKNEISVTLRKAHGGGGRGAPSGSGSANINRRPNPRRNSATSLLQVPCFWAPSLTLSVASFVFIFVFLFG